MTGQAFPSVDYGALAPVLIVLGGACVSVLLEALLPLRVRGRAQLGLTLTVVAAALVAVIVRATSGAAPVSTLAGVAGRRRARAVPLGHAAGPRGAQRAAARRPLRRARRGVPRRPGGARRGRGRRAAGRRRRPRGRLVVGTVLAGGGGRTGRSGRGLGRGQTPIESQSEIYALVLFALGGMLVFCAADDLLTMFVALEVLSLPLYLLCGLARRRRLMSQESAVKYFLLGAFSSAFFLYGLALLYGYADSVKLSDISLAAAGSLRPDSLLFGGLALLVVGLLFKASVGPFHTWTPDVYQGAPTSVTAFMAACTKVAAFGAILRVFTVAFGSTVWEWRGVLWVVAIASMVIGAVLGLTQTDVKRMIAYSSVAHAGFLLLGAMAITPQGLSATLFYLLAYGFTTVALFGLVSLVRGPDGEATHLSAWAGLGKRAPVVAAAVTFLMLALAGIPLTSGFTAKFAVFAAALADGMAPLVIVALVVSAVAAFFYLRLIVLMYFSEPAADGPTVSVPGPFTTVAITLGVVVTLLLGVVPTAVLGWADGLSFLG